MAEAESFVPFQCTRNDVIWRLKSYKHDWISAFRAEFRLYPRIRRIETLPNEWEAFGCGWNSTLKSIVKGVPLICRPFQSEQKRLIVDEEGAEMRDRALVLKEKFKVSLISGGSSNNALDEFVK
ncbi:hypothetical protein F2Q68_00025408 [Brassica cretica]|uniref:Uncharacterized protein n=1 Tax=Brassica cretica TaxID=69181 RepID=A0A8S9IE64_BRACR|nr:hypothetical protein F2Q68_00025408 [Brassica cretica]